MLYMYKCAFKLYRSCTIINCCKVIGHRDAATRRPRSNPPTLALRAVPPPVVAGRRTGPRRHRCGWLHTRTRAPRGLDTRANLRVFTLLPPDGKLDCSDPAKDNAPGDVGDGPEWVAVAAARKHLALATEDGTRVQGAGLHGARRNARGEAAGELRQHGADRGTLRVLPAPRRAGVLPTHSLLLRRCVAFCRLPAETDSRIPGFEWNPGIMATKFQRVSRHARGHKRKCGARSSDAGTSTRAHWLVASDLFRPFCGLNPRKGLRTPSAYSSFVFAASNAHISASQYAQTGSHI